MRVFCQANTGKNLPDKLRHFHETDETAFSPLKIGDEYTVYGVMFLSDRVDYLVYPAIHDSNWIHGPHWMPGPLFKVLDATLPSWQICLAENQPDYQSLFAMFGITALIGYEELVSNPLHYNGILDRDPDELQKFFVEKMKIDRWLREAE